MQSRSPANDITAPIFSLVWPEPCKVRGSVDTSLHAVCGLHQPTATALKRTGASEPVLHKKKQTGNEDITITKILKKQVIFLENLKI